MSAGAEKSPNTAQQRILESAFVEFYRCGFRSGSLSRIIANAGTSKGTLFHHFVSKQQLGYAVLDSVIGPIMFQRWIDPLAVAKDPVTVIQESFRQVVRADIESGFWLQGCPLNNLAQEMSPLDEGFQARINALYDLWRDRIAQALKRGIEEGTVSKSTEPDKVATLVVAAQMGIWGSAKSSQNTDVMIQGAETLCGYLDTLRK